MIPFDQIFIGFYIFGAACIAIITAAFLADTVIRILYYRQDSTKIKVDYAVEEISSKVSKIIVDNVNNNPHNDWCRENTDEIGGNGNAEHE